MQQKFDVAIIGGGPIGGNIAEKIAKEKYKTAIFEQKKQIGKPLKCAGLVTKRVFDFVNISEKDVIQNKIKGANIHSPSDNILTIGGEKTQAYVIDRILFDNEIINSAKKAGAELFLQSKIISAQKQNKEISLVNSNNKSFKCKLLIGADGPHSTVRDLFGFAKPSEYLVGMGAEIIHTNLNPDFVEIFVGNNVAPGFFAWIIPTNKDGSNARIGLCVKQNASHPAKYYFSKFLENNNCLKFLDNTKVKSYIGGVVPLGFLKKTYASNVMLVGDAAAQVKPTSGGGIYPGLLCSKYCSEVAIDCLKDKNFSENNIKRYNKNWASDIGMELKMGMKFRNIFKNLSDKQMDKYILKFSDPKIRDIITEYGDIDHPTKLVKPLLKKSPSLLKFVPSLFKN